MKRIFSILFSPDFFKASFFLVSILGVCPLLSPILEPYLKVFHLYAMTVLIFDAIGEKRIFRNKGRILLVIFVFSYVITLANNSNLLNFSGVSNYLYLFETLAVVYSYGKNSEKHARVTITILCTLISLANLIGIWMFFSKFSFYVPDRGYIGMYPMENRLAGLFGNPNVLGMVCLSTICLCAVGSVLCSHRRIKGYFVILGAINLVTLLLSNSRTQIYSIVLFCTILSFMMTLKLGKSVKYMLVAIGVASMCMICTFAGSKLLQRGLSLVDINYDYYLQNIDSEVAKTQVDEELLKIEKTIVEDSEFETTYIEKINPNENAPDKNISSENTSNESAVEESQKPNEKIKSINRLETTGLNGRVELWYSGYKLFVAKPIFGSGMDNHNEALKALGYEALPVKGNLHNVYLEILVCFGIIGFGCLLVYLIIMFCNVIKFFKYNDGKTWTQGAVLLASIVAFMLDGVADSTLVASFYPTAVAFWLLASQFARLLEEENLRTGHYRQEVLWKIIDTFFRRKEK